MKLFLILPVLFISFNVSKAQSNKYHPIPTKNVYWNENSWYMFGTCRVSDDYSLYFNGDTLIGSNTYHKIYRSGFISASCPPPGHYYSNVYNGALRQDSLLKKVFFFPTVGYTSETLLYDFDLKLGDTLPQTYNGGSQYYVIDIDSILVGSTYNKRFLLSLLGSPVLRDTTYAIIEGIGSPFGLFNPIHLPFEEGSYLNCYSFNGQTYPYNSNCIIQLGITKSSTMNASIYPNPFSTKTTIQADHFFTNASLTLSNNLGKIILEIKNIYGQEIILDRATLQSGVYILKLEEVEQIFIDKLIITDN